MGNQNLQKRKFEEYLENTIGNLKYKNEKYKKLYQEYNDLLSKNKNLNWILEGQIEGRTLNNYECKMLSKLVQIFYDMKEIEAKELFFLGATKHTFTSKIWTF